jgi:hypothetical protein
MNQLTIEDIHIAMEEKGLNAESDRLREIMADFHTDYDRAMRLIGTLESYLGMWKPPVVKDVEGHPI